MGKREEELYKKISREHGKKARQTLEAKYGPDPYKVIGKRGGRPKKKKSK